ncbi:hypothetical protein LINPERPRIM_LOCUS10913, partial [Linum perenne]
GPAAIIEADQVRRREAEQEEVKQRKAKGKGQQHGPLQPGNLRQASLRRSQVHAYHSVDPLRSFEGNIASVRLIFSLF